MKKFFVEIWDGITYAYGLYSSFIHDIFPSQLGDLVEFIINIAIVCVIVRAVAAYAFNTRNQNRTS